MAISLPPGPNPRPMSPDRCPPRLSPSPQPLLIWQQLDRRRQQQVAQLVAELIRRQYPLRDPPESSHEHTES